jgi:minor tail protein
LEGAGLLRELSNVEKALGRTEAFIRKHPLAAITGFGTAAIAAGLQLAQMAEETNKALGVIATRVPGAVGHIDNLRHIASELAIQFGVTHDEVIGVMEATSRAGAKSVEDLTAVTTAALRLGVALNEDGQKFVGGLDAALDLFGKTGKDATAVAALFFDAASRGKTDVEGLTESLVGIAPKIQGTGLDFTTTLLALAELIDQGFEPGRKVISRFGDVLEEKGVRGIRDLADAAGGEHSAEEAMSRFTAAVERNESSLKNNAQRGQSQLKAGLLEIGSVLEKVAGKGVGFGLSLLEFFGKGGLGGAAATGRLEARAAGQAVADAAGQASAAIADLGKTGGIAAAGVKVLTDAQAKAVQSSKELSEEEKRGLLVSVKLSDDQKKLLTKALKEETAARKAAATEAAENQKKAARIFADIQELGQKTQRDLLTGHQKEMAELTAAFESKITELEETEGNKRVTQARAILDQAKRDLVQHWAGIDQDVVPKITRVQSTTKDLTGSTEDLDDAIARLRERTRGGTQADIDAATEKAKLKQRVDDLINPIKRASENTAEWADKILAVADALGISDDRMRQAVQNIHIIDQAIGDLHDSLSDLAGASSIGGGLTGILGAITAGASVIKAVGGVLNSLFGDSAETKARKELLRRNTEALRDLTEAEIDRLRADTPGATFLGVQQGLEAFFARTPAQETRTGAFGIRTKADIAADLFTDLAKFGVTIGDLEEIAKSLTLDLRNPQTGAIEPGALQQVLKKLAGIDFTKIGDSFADQLGHLEDLIDAGVVQPSEKFGRILDILGKPGSAAKGITEALAGVDVGTAEGRAAAKAILQGLIANFNDLSAGDIGTLTQGQFVDVVKQLIGLLVSDVTAGPSSEPGPQVQPPAGAAPAGTEADPVSVEPIPDPIFTPNLEAANWEALLGIDRHQAETLDQILATLSIPPSSGVVLPAGFLQSPTVTGPGSSTLNVQAGAIVLTINAPGGDPAAVQAAASAALVEAFDALMDGRRLTEKQNVGDASRT